MISDNDRFVIALGRSPLGRAIDNLKFTMRLLGECSTHLEDRQEPGREIVVDSVAALKEISDKLLKINDDLRWYQNWKPEEVKSVPV
jgi:hypothetical protein